MRQKFYPRFCAVRMWRFIPVYNSDCPDCFPPARCGAQARKSYPLSRDGRTYECLKERKVYINRQMDERYSLWMANAIYDKEEMNMIVMVWGSHGNG